MSQEPKVTRFGADPTVDQELATKIYVDNSSGGGGGAYLLTSGFTANFTAGGDDRFFPVSVSLNTGQGTESETQCKIYQAATLTDLGVRVSFNSRASESNCSFRDDGASLGTTTVPANTTGYFETNGLSDVIADDSQINFLMQVGAASGTFQCRVFCVRLTL